MTVRVGLRARMRMRVKVRVGVEGEGEGEGDESASYLLQVAEGAARTLARKKDDVLSAWKPSPSVHPGCFGEIRFGQTSDSRDPRLGRARFGSREAGGRAGLN